MYLVKLMGAFGLVILALVGKSLVIYGSQEKLPHLVSWGFAALGAVAVVMTVILIREYRRR